MITEGYKINIEFDAKLEDQTLEGVLIDTIELNHMSRLGKVFTYQMNIMDENNIVYMWFKDDGNIDYFVTLDR